MHFKCLPHFYVETIKMWRLLQEKERGFTVISKYMWIFTYFQREKITLKYFIILNLLQKNFTVIFSNITHKNHKLQKNTKRRKWDVCCNFRYRKNILMLKLYLHFYLHMHVNSQVINVISQFQKNVSCHSICTFFTVRNV